MSYTPSSTVKAPSTVSSNRDPLCLAFPETPTPQTFSLFREQQSARNLFPGKYARPICRRYGSRSNITPTATNTIPSTFTVVTRSLPFSTPNNNVING